MFELVFLLGSLVKVEFLGDLVMCKVIIEFFIFLNLFDLCCGFNEGIVVV